MPDAETHRPLVALAMGDPAGIGSELAARALVDPEVRAVCDIVAIGDARALAAGANVAGCRLNVETIEADTPLFVAEQPVFVDLKRLDPASLHAAKPSRAGGAFALANFRVALGLARLGAVDAVAFTPFNKTAMRLADPDYEDEIVYAAKATGFAGTAREFNILDGLWNARLTSHVPLAAVAGLITAERVREGIAFTDRSLREAGVARPRIAVAALNPHAGENGLFGREEIETIAPAVGEMKAGGIDCAGPFPADTVFVRARSGEFDAVVSMYHDQGQIAMKLIGFERGVTLLGGFDTPILTPAHGSAYDIAGKGVAHPGATRQALIIAARMGAARRQLAGAPERPLVTALEAERALAA